MRLTKWILLAIVGLPVAELLFFMAVSATIGFIPALLLLLGTSFFGLSILRSTGRDGVNGFRAAWAREGIAATIKQGGRTELVLSGILLLIPGFITDIAGALLFVPTVRRGLVGYEERARRRRHASPEDQVIDLTPTEWRQIEAKPPPKRRPRPRKPRS